MLYIFFNAYEAVVQEDQLGNILRQLVIMGFTVRNYGQLFTNAVALEVCRPD